MSARPRRARDIEISLGLSQGAIWHRLRDGWSLAEALGTPKLEQARSDSDRNGMLTAELLRQLLDYCSNTGEFRWNVNVPGARQGALAGGIDDKGYLRISIQGRRYRAHRLAWLYVHGSWPLADCDHKNGIKSDNRIDNLRDVSRQVNSQNRQRARRDSGSGLLGACPDGRRFRALICVDGEQMHLGTFDSKEDAHAVYLAAKRQLHAGCTL